MLTVIIILQGFVQEFWSGRKLYSMYVFLSRYSLLCFPLVLLLSFIWQWFSKGASALGTQCTLNAHSIHIDRVRTRNVKVPNRIKCALSQSTSVCGSNPVRSGLEWNVGGRSLRHMTSVHGHSRMTSVHVRGTYIVVIWERRRLCWVYWRGCWREKPTRRDNKKQSYLPKGS